MFGRTSVCLVALAAVLISFLVDTRAHDAANYPDWSGGWRIKGGNRWDPTKPTGLDQQAPEVGLGRGVVRVRRDGSVELPDAHPPVHGARDPEEPTRDVPVPGR